MDQKKKTILRKSTLNIGGQKAIFTAVAGTQSFPNCIGQNMKCQIVVENSQVRFKKTFFVANGNGNSRTVGNHCILVVFVQLLLH